MLKTNGFYDWYIEHNEAGSFTALQLQYALGTIFILNKSTCKLLHLWNLELFFQKI